MHHRVVRRVERFPFEFGGEHGHRAVVFVAHQPAIAVLAGELTALVVEGIPVGVAGGVTKNADVTVVFDPAHLNVVGNVAPKEVAADAIPGRAFRPQRPDVQTLNRGVPQLVLVESLVQRNDVRIRVADGVFP